MDAQSAVSGDAYQGNGSAPLDPVRRPKEAAAYTGLSESRLAKLRMCGEGPRFIKLSATRVGYRQSALEAWLRERERMSTLEDPKKAPGGA